MILRLFPALVIAATLSACFPALERPLQLQDLDGDGFVGVDDCDDADLEAFPDAAEVCDGIDQDCDGQIDEGLPDLWYPDGDDDGVGAITTPFQGCEPPADHVESTGDCNDSDAAIQTAQFFYPDLDLDGFGDADSGVSTCDPPSDWLADGSDCDDSSDAVNPNGTEVCDPNDIDEDCDGFADDLDPEGAAGEGSWRADGDGDGYGVGTVVTACDLPQAGWAAGEEDCNDGDPDLHPDTVWYVDLDEDGYGTTAEGSTGCTVPATAAPRDGDCADNDSARNPGEPEVCDAGTVDEDCDGLANEADPEGASGAVTYYIDFDNDGYGDEISATLECTPPGAGWILVGGDCDDENGGANPDEAETCDLDGVDEDCDGFANADDPEGAAGQLTLYPDNDEDGWGLLGSAATTSCDPIEGMADREGDCNDNDPAVHPETNWCQDLDGDGYGDNSRPPVIGCTGPADTVPNCADCDDTSPTAFADGDWYIDSDFDNFGDDETIVVSCTQPSPPFVGQWVRLGGDCNDDNNRTFPNAPELCQDGEDNSCVGTGDDLCMPDGFWDLDDLSTVIYGQSLGDRAGSSLVAIPGTAPAELVVGSAGGSRTHHVPIVQGVTTLAAGDNGYSSSASGLGHSLAMMERSVLAGEPLAPGALALPTDPSGNEDALTSATSVMGGGGTNELGSLVGTGVVSGDFDGDGTLDAILCDPAGTTGLDTGSGQVGTFTRLHLLPGPLESSIDIGNEGVRYTLPVAGGACGAMVVTPDLAGADGISDLLLGIPSADTVLLINGASLSRGLAEPVALMIPGAEGSSFGASLAVGDSFLGTTVAIGAPSADGGGAVVLIDPSNADDGPSATLTGSGGLGSSLALPGDLDGDGTEDLVVASNPLGRVYAVDGTALTTGGQSIAGRTHAIFETGQVAELDLYAADLNGDGVGDLAVAGPTMGTSRGRVWVLYGTP